MIHPFSTFLNTMLQYWVAGQNTGASSGYHVLSLDSVLSSIVDLTFRITTCRSLLAIAFRTWDLVCINLSFASRDFVCTRMTSISIARQRHQKGQKNANHDVHVKHHFFLPNHLKKAKYLEFGLKNAKLVTLLLTSCFLVVNMLLYDITSDIMSSAGQALSRCSRYSCIGPCASWDPVTWCLGRLFIFSRYSLRSRA